jgi:hypothetical protein
MRRSRSLLTAAAVAAALVAPLTAQYRMEPGGEGSLRIVISCNVDGSYTCANERCGQYCCNMPG